ncbi:MAG: hypothetical protein AAGA90_00155 [Actinomycetota bacterium]
MEQGFFDHVRDAVQSLVGDDHGEVHGSSHRRGVKVWFGTTDGRAAKEHYEAQLIRLDGDVALEIGFHAEHRDPEANEDVLRRLLDAERSWRRELGDEAEAGPFLGMDAWTRVSEVWPAPDPDDPEAPMEIAARLADYVDALEPPRQSPA